MFEQEPQRVLLRSFPAHAGEVGEAKRSSEGVLGDSRSTRPHPSRCACHLPRRGGEGAQSRARSAESGEESELSVHAIVLHSGMLSHKQYRALTQATPQAKARAKELRNELTPPEAMLWSVLKNNQLNGIAYRTQHAIGAYITDFYCHRARLVIEIDGSSHRGDQILHDRDRDEWMRERGIEIMRIQAHEVLDNLSGVYATIGARTQKRIQELTPSP